VSPFHPVCNTSGVNMMLSLTVIPYCVGEAYLDPCATLEGVPSRVARKKPHHRHSSSYSGMLCSPPPLAPSTQSSCLLLCEEFTQLENLSVPRPCCPSPMLVEPGRSGSVGAVALLSETRELESPCLLSLWKPCCKGPTMPLFHITEFSLPQTWEVRTGY